MIRNGMEKETKGFQMYVSVMFYFLIKTNKMLIFIKLDCS